MSKVNQKALHQLHKLVLDFFFPQAENMQEVKEITLPFITVEKKNLNKNNPANCYYANNPSER